MLHSSFKAIATPGCVLVGWFWLGPSLLIAQHATQPRVTVVTFEGSGAPRDVRDAMADELAARLVDTGHFRVLHREWFPHDSDQVPELDALRATAKSVNVDYLVLGSIRESTRVPPASSSVMTSRAFSPAVAGPAMLPRQARQSRAPEQTTVVVNIRVVDVTTADVVRTATAQRTYVSNSSSRGPFFVPPGNTPTTLVATIATLAARPHAAPTRLTKDWRKVVEDVARQLDARGIPASPRR